MHGRERSVVAPLSLRVGAPGAAGAGRPRALMLRHAAALLLPLLAAAEGCGFGYTCVYASAHGCAPLWNTAKMVCCSDGQQGQPGISAVCDATNATKLPFCPAGGATGSGCMRTSSAIGRGLTLTVFNNTALAGPGRARVVDSLERLSLASPGTDGPSSVLLSGALAPSTAGKFGFELTFDPPLPFPSPTAYARLWVDDHLLFPRNTTLNPSPEAASSAPLWIPLPPRALRGEDVVATPGGAPLANSIRLTVVCLARTGCGPRSVTLRWASVASDEPWPPAPLFLPIPPSALVPLPPATEVARRALATRLEQGWGTFYNPSVVTWELLPEVRRGAATSTACMAGHGA